MFYVHRHGFVLENTIASPTTIGAVHDSCALDVSKSKDDFVLHFGPSKRRKKEKKKKKKSPPTNILNFQCIYFEIACYLRS